MGTSPFLFTQANVATGEVASSPSHADEALHPSARSSLVHAGRFLLVLDGITSNRRLDKVSGSLLPLQITAPHQELRAFTMAFPGGGQVYGLNYKYRFRWKNSVTGEVSGLSVLPPEGLNLGAEVIPGSNDHIGETAVVSLDVSLRPPGVDTVEWFRNASQGSTFFRHSETFITDTYATLVDDLPDEYLLAGGETSSLRPAPTWNTGIMPPMCRAAQHSNGRTMYYGQQRMGSCKTGSVTVYAAGDQAVNPPIDPQYVLPNAGGIFTQKPFVKVNRVGQRLRLLTKVSGGAAIQDPTAYRLIDVKHGTGGLGANVMYVYPPVISNPQMTQNSVTCYFTIEDDRDLRAVWLSAVGQPTQLDASEGFQQILYFGAHPSDSPCLIASVGGADACITRCKVYRVDGLATEDPFLNVQLIEKADEGACGIWAACWTPFGICYLNETNGPRVFDGQNVMALGGGGVLQPFPGKTQWDALEKGCLDQAVMYYDTERNLVFLAGVFMAGSDLEVFFIFDPNTGGWRGPHRGSRTTHGSLEFPSAESTEVSGDQYGNLLDEEAQVLDVVVATTHTLTGTLSSVSRHTLVTDSSGAFDAASDQRLRGCPIVFSDGTTSFYSVIAEALSATQLRLLFRPISIDGTEGSPATGWTYGIGSIPWRLRTGHLDGSDPIRPKVAERLRLRHQRAGASASSFTAGAASNADGTYTSDSGAKKTVDPSSTTGAEVTLKVAGVAVTLELAGVSRTGDPQIVGAVLDMDVRDGASADAAVGT